MELISLSAKGLRVADTEIYIDAWKSVPVNLVSHAHGDHAHKGSQIYWSTLGSSKVMQKRLGEDINLSIAKENQKFLMQGYWISFHPAGHIMGSSQIRVEAQNSPSSVAVFSGDYKRELDPTCKPFEPLECETFITESTFGLPIYDWDPTENVISEIYQWWQLNKVLGKTSLLFCYSLGKAQRILSELMKFTDEEVFAHGAIENLNQIYKVLEIPMLGTKPITDDIKDFAGRLIIAPPSAHRSVWMKKFKNISTGFASGWMSVRGIRKGRSYDKGFVLSDHADWKGLVETVKQTKASRIYVTHGSKDIFSKYLRDTLNLDARPLETQYEDEDA